MSLCGFSGPANASTSFWHPFPLSHLAKSSMSARGAFRKRFVNLFTTPSLEAGSALISRSAATSSSATPPPCSEGNTLTSEAIAGGGITGALPSGIRQIRASTLHAASEAEECWATTP